jgi:hypothetical protein
MNVLTVVGEALQYESDEESFEDEEEGSDDEDESDDDEAPGSIPPLAVPLGDEAANPECKQQ